MANAYDTGLELLATLCDCLAAHVAATPDFATRCACFNNNNPDLCCNARLYWGGEIPLCQGGFVSFVGAEPAEFLSNDCNALRVGVYLVGVTLCPPDENNAALLEQYATCLFEMSTAVNACLVDCSNCGKDMEVSGVRADTAGFFFEVRKRLG